MIKLIVGTKGSGISVRDRSRHHQPMLLLLQQKQD